MREPRGAMRHLADCSAFLASAICWSALCAPRVVLAESSAYRPGAAFVDCADCPNMVVIGAGRFTMGSTREERVKLGVPSIFNVMESPRHQVTVTYKFALARYSVTFAQWDACLADGGCGGYSPDDNGWGRGRRPVINVNFADAQNYVAWLVKRTGRRYRLPSEAEWEYAGRAGTHGWWYFGNAIDPDKANYGNHNDRTQPVGSYPPNSMGLYDMTGNTAQWTQDCHHPSYEGAPADGSPWTTSDCPMRNVRGGAWSLKDWSVRIAQRIGDLADTRNSHLGFRVARDLP